MDRENVIKGLEELEGFLFKEYTNIKAEESKIYYDRFKSLSDAIDLLKEQEARILQWDEIKDYPVVYGEFKGVADIYPLIITLDNFGRCLSWNPEINVSSEYLLLVSDEEDRKDTRCWNKMPTDEQRQAVKWE